MGRTARVRIRAWVLVLLQGAAAVCAWGALWDADDANVEYGLKRGRPSQLSALYTVSNLCSIIARVPRFLGVLVLLLCELLGAAAATQWHHHPSSQEK